ncbi:MAG: hypothetical protein WAO69_02125 [Aestuariivita sp.]|uniref:hypothetical protein n=1 Tax=Aestuariivita sp. TaxID=1872407 RepID=UPI003BAE2694
MFKRPGVPFFTRAGLALFLAGLIAGGGIMFVIIDFESLFFAIQTGLMVGLALMTIRWRIAEEKVIKARKEQS